MHVKLSILLIAAVVLTACSLTPEERAQRAARLKELNDRTTQACRDDFDLLLHGCKVFVNDGRGPSGSTARDLLGR